MDLKEACIREAGLVFSTEQVMSLSGSVSIKKGSFPYDTVCVLGVKKGIEFPIDIGKESKRGEISMVTVKDDEIGVIPKYPLMIDKFVLKRR